MVDIDGTKHWVLDGDKFNEDLNFCLFQMLHKSCWKSDM